MNSKTSAKPEKTLRYGWTTGACATAATKAALTALVTGKFPDPVGIILPKGEVPYFSLALESLGDGYALAGIVKDAGDDPDVTHGATIISQVQAAAPGTGIIFKAGEGVGMVTRAGLPIPPGEPAINPVPRQMMRGICEEICAKYKLPTDLIITLSVPNGETIAKKTWNPRLGIVGGISILGTTGIVRPYSCAAWIHSIHRGIDVARAAKQNRIIAATGSASEAAAQSIHHLPEFALIDMGDFVGAVLKYLRHHPLPNITLAGGFAKFTKLAQGAIDLHSSRSQVNFAFLWQLASQLGMDAKHKDSIISANTAKEVLEITSAHGINIVEPVVRAAKQIAENQLQGAPIGVEVIITNRKGDIIGRI